MKDIRIGNDIIVKWSIFGDGAPYILEGKDVSLYLCTPFGKRKAEGFSIVGNQITWTFAGKDQSRTGKYSLELVVNADKEGQVTTDVCNFVNLVNCSCKVGGTDESNVEIESISLTSELGFLPYDDAELREAIATLEREKVDKEEGKGLSTNDYTDEEKEKNVVASFLNGKSLQGLPFGYVGGTYQSYQFDGEVNDEIDLGVIKEAYYGNIAFSYEDKLYEFKIQDLKGEGAILGTILVRVTDDSHLIVKPFAPRKTLLGWRTYGDKTKMPSTWVEGGGGSGGGSYDDTGIKKDISDLKANDVELDEQLKSISELVNDFNGDISTLYNTTNLQETKLTKLSEEIYEIVGNKTIVCPNNQYFQVNKIAVGEEISITLNEVATQGRAITFFAKTSTSDSSYQSLGTIAVDGKLSVTADREINYIRAYNDNADAFPATITMQTSNGVIGRLEKLENEVEELAKAAEANEEILDYIGYQEFTFANNQYTPFHIEQGKEYKITALDVQGGRRISFFAKTETSDGTYQRLGDLLKGESAIFVADREINYVRAYSDYGDAFPVKMLLQSTDGLSYQLSELQKNVAEAKTIPCMYNPSINWSKGTLNVLDIGNSYTGDCHTYLPNIIAASNAEVNLNLYKAIRSSGSFKTWVDCYNNRDNSTYSVSKTYGESLGVDGSGAANNGELFRNALAVKWDVILIHQVSNFATDFDSWETQSASGYLKEFIQILRKTNPQATIGFLMVHSYRSNYSANTEKSSELRFAKIVDATKRLVREYGIDFVIPYGTAVQNLRASSLNDSYEFSEDGTHLGEGMGDYVAACCYYQSMIAPINGVSIMGNTFRVTGLTEGNGKKNVTDETAPIVQKAALLATCNMWEVVNPEDYDL